MKKAVGKSILHTHTHTHKRKKKKEDNLIESRHVHCLTGSIYQTEHKGRSGFKKNLRPK